MLARPELKKRFEDLGTYIRPTTPEELTAFIREQQQILAAGDRGDREKTSDRRFTCRG